MGQERTIGYKAMLVEFHITHNASKGYESRFEVDMKRSGPGDLKDIHPVFDQAVRISVDGSAAFYYGWVW